MVSHMTSTAWHVRSRALLAVGALLLAACGEASADPGKKESSDPIYQGLSGTLTVLDTDGGPVLKAKEETIYKNFEQLTGVRIRSDYQPDITKMLATLESGQSPWAVAEIFSGDYLELNRAVHTSADSVEGMNAWRDRRPAKYQNR